MKKIGILIVFILFGGVMMAQPNPTSLKLYSSMSLRKVLKLKPTLYGIKLKQNMLNEGVDGIEVRMWARETYDKNESTWHNAEGLIYGAAATKNITALQEQSHEYLIAFAGDWCRTKPDYTDPYVMCSDRTFAQSNAKWKETAILWGEWYAMMANMMESSSQEIPVVIELVFYGNATVSMINELILPGIPYTIDPNNYKPISLIEFQKDGGILNELFDEKNRDNQNKIEISSIEKKRNRVMEVELQSKKNPTDMVYLKADEALVKFKNGQQISLNFGEDRTRTDAALSELANEYADYLAMMPNILRRNITSIYISMDEDTKVDINDKTGLIVLNHDTNNTPVNYRAESLFHEAVHSANRAFVYPFTNNKDWDFAQETDEQELFEYSHRLPAKEDHSMTFLAYMLARYGPERYAAIYSSWEATVPNRWAYYNSKIKKYWYFPMDGDDRHESDFLRNLEVDLLPGGMEVEEAADGTLPVINVPSGGFIYRVKWEENPSSAIRPGILTIYMNGHKMETRFFHGGDFTSYDFKITPDMLEEDEDFLLPKVCIRAELSTYANGINKEERATTSSGSNCFTVGTLPGDSHARKEMEPLPLPVDDKNITSFQVYPNPASANDEVILSIPDDISGLLYPSVTVHDMNGRLVDRFTVDVTDSKGVIYPVHNMKKGIYIITLQTGSDACGQKLVIK